MENKCMKCAKFPFCMYNGKDCNKFEKRKLGVKIEIVKDKGGK